MSNMNNYLRLRRGAIHLHNLGPRPFGHFLLELGERLSATDEILDALDEWQALNPDVVRELEGHSFPRLMRAVPR